MVTDAMREKYPGIDAAFTNSGGLRQNLVFTPPSAGEQPGEITWGEMFAVLPFGNRTTILTLTGAQLQTAFLNGFTPFCDPTFAGGSMVRLASLEANRAVAVGLQQGRSLVALTSGGQCIRTCESPT